MELQTSELLGSSRPDEPSSLTYTTHELEVLVKEWHMCTDSRWSNADLHEFLGWTWHEYAYWAESGEQPLKERPSHVAYYLSGH